MEYLIDEENGKTGWLVAAFLEWGLGVISRLIVKDEPQNGCLVSGKYPLTGHKSSYKTKGTPRSAPKVFLFYVC